ncbi:BLUF domain containing protein [Burkholderiales bacterium]
MTSPDEPQRDEPLKGLRDDLLYNLVYCSHASAGADDKTVDAIVATSRRRNPPLGITGLLVFGGGVFFQWIEGPKAHVTRLMELITSDPRHETVVILSTSEEVRERIFPNWDMELVGQEDIREVLLDALEQANDAQSSAALQLLLERVA